MLAPRRVPPCLMTSVIVSKSRMKEMAPEATPCVFMTLSPAGRSSEKEKPVPPPDFLDRPHHDRPRHLALLHGPVRDRFFDGHDDRVSEGGVALVGAAHHPDALDLLGLGVVGYVEHRARLDHR